MYPDFSSWRADRAGVKCTSFGFNEVAPANKRSTVIDGKLYAQGGSSKRPIEEKKSVCYLCQARIDGIKALDFHEAKFHNGEKCF